MPSLNVQKRCPKCNGSIYLDDDFHGWYEQCLQCGYIRDIVAVSKGPKVESNARDANRDLISQI